MPITNDHRLLYLYGDEFDLATLSGGSWQAGLPRSNMQEPRLELVARTADLSLASTQFNIALKATTEIAAIYVGWTNLTPQAGVQLVIWPDATFSGVPDHDTGSVEGLIPDDDDPDRGPSLYLPLAQSRPAQFLSLKFDDQGNPAGYLDFALCKLGAYLRPSINYTYGANNFALTPNAIISSTLSGDEQVWDRQEARVFRSSFDMLPETELFGDVYTMLRKVKRGGQVVVFPNPSAAPLEMQRRSFLGRATAREGIAQSYFQRGGVGIEIRELIGLAPPILATVYRLTAETGSFTLTGRDVTLSLMRRMSAETGVFVLTGQAVTLSRSLRLAAETGSFALTGNDIAINFGTSLTAETGVFTLTGNDVGFRRDYSIDAQTGSFTLTGNDVGLIRALIMAAGAGSFVLTGNDVVMTSGIRMLAETGVFVLTGNDVTLQRSLIMAASTASFTLTGNDVGLHRGYTLTAGTGSFTLTGINVNLSTYPLRITEAGDIRITEAGDRRRT